MTTKSTGSAAEHAVARYLTELGYKIIDINWKTTYAEIDVIAIKGKCVYFVEVKYRQNDQAGDGFDYITTKKLQHMDRAAVAWVTQNNWSNEHCLLAVAVEARDDDQYKFDLRELI
jgi:uncharacterized protein (TIGR00252 family)